MGTRSVAIDSIRYEYGFGFKDLYHPYNEVFAAGKVAVATELLADFYDSMEKWRVGLNNWKALPIQAWRFGKSKRTERLECRVPSVHFGWLPGGGSQQALERVEHLFWLRNSIQKDGYMPKHGQSIEGVWVGKTFLVLAGQHRVAVLASLGWEKIPVQNIGRKNTPKKLVSKRLPLVKSGHLPLTDARAILRQVETGFSRHEAHAAGFPFANEKDL